jgi:hypothetical protein
MGRSSILKLFSMFALLLMSSSVSIIAFQNTNVYAKERAGAVLTPAYSFFVNLKNHNYIKLWPLLTSFSKQTIVNNIEKSFIRNKIKIGVRRINKSMKNGGYIAKSYWKGFLKGFNPNMVLKYSVWKIKSIGSTTAQIEIDYKYAKAPTFLKIYKQKGRWKLGLFETFYNRLLMKKITNGILNKF